MRDLHFETTLSQVSKNFAFQLQLQRFFFFFS